MDQKPALRQYIAAWSVHAFTLSGLLWAALAMDSLIRGQIHLMWLWLGIALIVDGLDGTFARRCRVKEVIPWFDGGILDIVIDYLTWTFIPAVFMFLYLPLGPHWLAVSLAVVVLTSSMFCYANMNWKSTDHYFVGFPAAWNIVAVVMYVHGTPAWLNIAATLILAVLTLVPTHYTHPFRVRNLMLINILAISIWIFATSWLIVVAPERPWWLLFLFWFSGGWFILSGILRTVLGKIAMAKLAGDDTISSHSS